jgi:osmotically-inducible protein OsmY
MRTPYQDLPPGRDEKPQRESRMPGSREGQGQFWQGDFNPHGDVRGAKGQDPYYGALGYGDPVGASGVTSPYRTGMGYGASAVPQGSRASRPGPKGYQRSDERVLEDICEQLARRDDIDCSEVSLDVREGEVTLTGSVPERRMKHAIEDLAAECAGVREINNQLRVSPAL